MGARSGVRRASRARGVGASWSDRIADGAVGPAGEGRGREGGMVVKEGASAGVPMVGARGEELKWGLKAQASLLQ